MDARIGINMLLTASEIDALLESLKYSIRRIEDYPHQELSHKQTSLEPLLSAKDKLQLHKYEIKTNTKPMRVFSSVSKAEG